MSVHLYSAMFTPYMKSMLVALCRNGEREAERERETETEREGGRERETEKEILVLDIGWFNCVDLNWSITMGNGGWGAIERHAARHRKTGKLLFFVIEKIVRSPSWHPSWIYLLFCHKCLFWSAIVWRKSAWNVTEKEREGERERETETEAETS